MYFFPPFPPFEKGGVKTYNLDQPFPPFESLAPPFTPFYISNADFFQILNFKLSSK